MKNKNEMAMRLLDDITNIMDMQENEVGEKLWWCFCFGNMLEYAADKTFSLDYDIDIGVLYGQCDENKLISAITGHGYKVEKPIFNDVTKKMLNVHFKPVEDQLKGTPTIDVYFWLPVGDMLYHTYDYYKEGKKIPSEYVFKGVKRHWLIPDKKTIDLERGRGKPGRDQMLTDQGTWKFPIGEPGSSLTFRMPYAVGHLLDELYTKTWRFREYYREQSTSRWVQKVKSCADLK